MMIWIYIVINRFFIYCMCYNNADLCLSLVDNTEKYCAMIGRNVWLLKNSKDKTDAEIFIENKNILSALHSFSRK